MNTRAADVAEAVALADRVLVIEQGWIAHDVKIDIARPRRPWLCRSRRT